MANKAIGTLAVGSSVYLNVGGVRKEFLVVHQGLPSSLYDASCDGTWLLMKDCYEKRQWNSSESNVYETSTVNTYLNGPFLSLFDSNIQGIIKQVKIPYRTNGGSGGTDQSGANGLSVKIFQLSGYEIGWTTAIDPYLPVDGAKLAYFESGTSASAQNKRIAYLNGSAVDWWLRSVNGYSATSVWVVDSAGGSGVHGVSFSLAIHPALILPSTTLVDDSGNVVTVDLTAHKTLVGGTAYTVKGGKCMVDGTVYSILKGRTLIGGTGWDITFPSAIEMPAKGDLITMNLDGTDRQYRVLKIVDGTTVEVLSMGGVSLQYFSYQGDGKYADSNLDSFLDSTYYESLSARGKAAIVQKDVIQDQWTDGSSGSPTYTGTNSNPNDNHVYTISRVLSGNKTVGKRRVYALSIQSIIDYLSDKSVLAYPREMLVPANIWNAFFGRSEAVNEQVWLMTGNPSSRYAWVLSGLYGYMYDSIADSQNSVRPAFQIDLSKIDFTIN